MASSKVRPKEQLKAFHKKATQTIQDARHLWFRVVAAAVLLLLAIGLGLWLLAPREPDYSFAAKASLVVAAAVAFGAGAVCLPLGLRHRLGTFAIVAGTFAGLLATVLAIPDRSPVQLGPGESSRLPSESPSPFGSPNGPEPLTATFNFNLPMCEDFMVPTSLVDSLPGKSQINAQWAYENGGATLGAAELTVQGKTQDAVVLRGLRLIDVEKHTPPTDVATILPCGPGGGHLGVRYFEVNFGDQPGIIARPSEDENGNLDPDIGEPAVKFPFKVSNTEPEIFLLQISGPPCFCSWRIALDWISMGRSGTTVLDHGFGKIKSNTTKDIDGPFYYGLEDGTWQRHE